MCSTAVWANSVRGFLPLRNATLETVLAFSRPVPVHLEFSSHWSISCCSGCWMFGISSLAGRNSSSLLEVVYLHVMPGTAAAFLGPVGDWHWQHVPRKAELRGSEKREPRSIVLGIFSCWEFLSLAANSILRWQPRHNLSPLKGAPNWGQLEQKGLPISIHNHPSESR